MPSPARSADEAAAAFPLTDGPSATSLPRLSPAPAKSQAPTASAAELSKAGRTPRTQPSPRRCDAALSARGSEAPEPPDAYPTPSTVVPESSPPPVQPTSAGLGFPARSSTLTRYSDDTVAADAAVAPARKPSQSACLPLRSAGLADGVVRGPAPSPDSARVDDSESNRPRMPQLSGSEAVAAKEKVGSAPLTRLGAVAGPRPIGTVASTLPGSRSRSEAATAEGALRSDADRTRSGVRFAGLPPETAHEDAAAAAEAEPHPESEPVAATGKQKFRRTVWWRGIWVPADD